MPDNPFATDEQRAELRVSLAACFNLSNLNRHDYLAATVQYLTITAYSMAQRLGDDATGAYAIMNELAIIISTKCEPTEVAMPDCGHDACAERNAHEGAFIESASRGDIPAAMQVVRLLMAGAPVVEGLRTGPLAVCAFFADIVTSFAPH